MKTEPTPGLLEVVQPFVNTNDLEGTDELDRPEALREWLTARGLLDPSADVGERDVVRAQQLREAIRGLLVANAGGSGDPDAVDVLNRAAADAHLVVSFNADGSTTLSPTVTGVTGALGRILAVVHDAEAEGTWSRMKACRKHSCRWAFFDQSKNRSRTWCAMSVCGNRVKAQTYRERHKEDDPVSNMPPADFARS
jgi:predicted RNA-binding Zn ribbon-like protein